MSGTVVSVVLNTSAATLVKGAGAELADRFNLVVDQETSAHATSSGH